MNQIRFALFAIVLLNSQFVWRSTLTAAEGTRPAETVANHRVTEHSVTVVAKSFEDLQRLMARLPSSMSGTLSGFAGQISGPLASAVNHQAPLGLWFDWTDALPAPVVFLKNPQLSKLQLAIATSGVTTEEVEPGIFELGLKVPLYYSVQHDHLFIATMAEHLTSLQYAADLTTHLADVAVQVHVALGKIPAPIRSELAEALAQRLLPPAVTLADEDTAENLLKLYVTRMLRKFASQGKTIVLDINHTDDGFQLLVDIQGNRLGRISKQPSVFPNLSHIKTNQFISVCTDLSDEEVALLNWWSRSFADQVLQSFDQADVEDRTGRDALELGAKAIGDLVSKTAQTGVLEGFACLVGPNQEFPIVGLKVPDGNALDQTFRQIARMGTMRAMGVQSIELDLGTVGDAKIHRVSFGDSDEEIATVAVAIGNQCVYVTDGVAGLRQLRSFLESNSEKVSPQAFSLRFAGAEVAALIGYEETAATQQAKIEITSEYSDSGIKLKVDYSM